MIAMRPDVSSRPPALELEALTRRYGGLLAVDGVSLALDDGERMAVIGPNGAGKTTLFRLIAGEVAPTSGRVKLFGEDVTPMPAHRRARRGLSRTFQVSNLFSDLSVAENVRIAAQAQHADRWRFWSPVRARDAMSEATERVLLDMGLGDRLHDSVSQLSHGERRQLEIAMALVTNPRLLLLDEPAAGLSSQERARLRRVLDALPRSIPLILIEHDLELALGLADRVLCMHNGRPIALGAPQEVRGDKTVQSIYLGRGVDA